MNETKMIMFITGAICASFIAVLFMNIDPDIILSPETIDWGTPETVRVYVFDDGYTPISHDFEEDRWYCIDPYERVIDCKGFYTIEIQPTHPISE